MPFQIIRNDITKVKADAIVNTANPEVAIGEAAVTPAFALDAKYIIHVSSPCWDGGDKGEADLLKHCYDQALKLAADNDCKSVAFPLLAAGTYNFPSRLAMEIAVDAFTRFLEGSDMEIILVVFGEKSVKISGELGKEVLSFIDNEDVKEALTEEYRFESELPLRDGMLPDDEEVSSHKERIQSVRNGIPSVGKGFLSPRKEIRSAEKGMLLASKAFGAAVEDVGARPDSLDDVLKGIYKESFSMHLQKLINKKGLKNSEVYAAANISKQYFSKLLKGQVKPSKEKVLALAVGLHLNMDETIDFLRLAGYALSPISQTDAVVEYFIEHEDYSVMKIDIVLFDYGLDPLSNG